VAAVALYVFNSLAKSSASGPSSRLTISYSRDALAVSDFQIGFGEKKMNLPIVRLHYCCLIKSFNRFLGSSKLQTSIT
jgi:hypothetical protein